MTMDERIAKFDAEKNAFEAQIRQLDEQTKLMQQRRESLMVAWHRTDGALAALKDIQIADALENALTPEVERA